jgi:hypothetical protein
MCGSSICFSTAELTKTFAEQGYLEKSWEELASSQELVKVILAVIRHRTGIYGRLQGEGINVYRGLKSMINKGIVMKRENQVYTLSDPLFEPWIRRNIQKSLV